MKQINVYCQCGNIYSRERSKDLPKDVTGIGILCCDNCPSERFEYIDDFYEYHLFDNDTNQGWD